MAEGSSPDDETRGWRRSFTFLDRLQRLRKSASSTSPRLVTAVAALLFGGALVLALSRLPAVGELRWELLALVALVGAPLTVGFNTAEYMIAAGFARQKIPFLESTADSLLASAANILPLPGAALVRIQRFHSRGASFKRAAASTALVGMAFVSVAWVGGGAVLASAGFAILGMSLLVPGALLGLAVVPLARKLRSGPNGRLLAALFAVEIGSVGVLALRYYVVLAAFGGRASVASAAALAMASVITAAVGLVPAGLGLRELLAAAFASLTGLAPAVAVVTTGLDRAASLVGLIIVAGGIWVRRAQRGKPVAPAEVTSD